MHGRGRYTGQNRPMIDIEYDQWTTRAKRLITALKHAAGRECTIGGLADKEGMFTVETVFELTQSVTLRDSKGVMYTGLTQEDIEKVKRDHRKDQNLRFRTDESGKVGCAIRLSLALCFHAFVALCSLDNASGYMWLHVHPHTPL
jgi:hypothetical protein